MLSTTSANPAACSTEAISRDRAPAAGLSTWLWRTPRRESGATAALVGGPATAGLGRLVRLCSMSAFRPIATKQRTSPEVSNVPNTDIRADLRDYRDRN